MLCAYCDHRPMQSFLEVLTPVDGQVWPPFPICRSCYHFYARIGHSSGGDSALQAADRFVRECARRMAIRVGVV